MARLSVSTEQSAPEHAKALIAGQEADASGFTQPLDWNTALSASSSGLVAILAYDQHEVREDENGVACAAVHRRGESLAGHDVLELGSVVAAKDGYSTMLTVGGILLATARIYEGSAKIYSVIRNDNISSLKQANRLGFEPANTNEAEEFLRLRTLKPNRSLFVYDDGNDCRIARFLLDQARDGFQRSKRPDCPPVPLEFDVPILRNGLLEELWRSCCQQNCDHRSHCLIG